MFWTRSLGSFPFFGLTSKKILSKSGQASRTFFNNLCL